MNWPQLLGKARDSRCRLLSISLHVANLHVGQHQLAYPRSRWNTVMSSRFSFRIGAGQAAPEGLASQPSTELCVVRAVGLPF